MASAVAPGTTTEHLLIRNRSFSHGRNTSRDQFPLEVITHSPHGATLTYGAVNGVTPTGNGFAPGCIYCDLTNGAVYVNIGNNGLNNNAAATFQLIVDPTHFPMFSGNNAPIVVPAATTTLTLSPTLHAGKSIIVAPTGGLTISTPTGGATGTGNEYRIICSAAVTGGSLTLDLKNGSDLIKGFIHTYKATTFTDYSAATTANANEIVYNGTTTGGADAGDWFSVRDIAAATWLSSGWAVQSGTIATPYANH